MIQVLSTLSIQLGIIRHLPVALFGQLGGRPSIVNLAMTSVAPGVGATSIEAPNFWAIVPPVTVHAKVKLVTTFTVLLICAVNETGPPVAVAGFAIVMTGQQLAAGKIECRRSVIGEKAGLTAVASCLGRTIASGA